MLIAKGDVRGVLEIEKHVRNFKSSYGGNLFFHIHYVNLNGLGANRYE
jgi:hypothetical protein